MWDARELLVRKLLAARSSWNAKYSPSDNCLFYLSDLTGKPQLWKACPGSRGFRHDLVIPWHERIGDYRISPNGMIAFTSDRAGDEKWSIYVLSSEGLRLVSGEDGSINLLGAWDPGGTRLSFTSNKRNNVDFDVYVYNVESGETIRVAKGEGINIVEEWTPYGLLVVRRNTNLDSDILLVDPESGSVRVLTGHRDEALNYNPCYVGGGWMAYVSNEGGEWASIYLMNLETGDKIKVFDPGWDVEVIAYRDGYLYASVNESGSSTLYRLLIKDTRVEHVTSLKQRWVVTSIDPLPGGRMALVSASSPREGAEVYLFSVSVERLTWTTKLGLEDNLVEPTDFYYESFDGLRIHALYYKPKITARDSPPAVVWLHGGPESQSRPLFNPLQQAILAMGVAVFAPNFRGSTGYGKTFVHLDDVEKRGDAVKDVYYAVKHAVEEGLADPERLCVMGGSYGGYLTLMSMALYPDVWKCGVEIVGIVNLVTFIRNTSPYRRRYRIPEYGDPKEHYDIMIQLSPIAHAHKIRAPLMVVHGARDPRVPVTEAEQIVEALKSRGVPVKYIRLEDEGHGIVKVENRVRVYTEALKFIEKHLLSS